MSNRVYDNNGFFKSKANPIARSGILEYAGSSISPDLEPDRIYKVWRPESELNNPETIESFRLVPWFSRHEMVGESFKPAEQVGIQGVTGEEVFFDESDKTLKSTIKAFGSSLKKIIDNGTKDLSIGMLCDWVIGGGVNPDGEAYDVIQTNIRGNHLASVSEGRAGKGVSVMDAAEVVSFAMDALDFKPTNENEVIKMTLEEIKKAIAAMSDEDKAKLSATMKPKAEDADKSEDKPKSAEDKDEKAEDEDGEKGKKTPAAMDSSAIDTAIAKVVKPLQDKIKALEGSAMDEASVIKAINSKNALAADVSRHIGAFDHNSMTSELEVSKYGVKKLGISCDSGEELAHLKGWLAAKSQPVVVNAIAEDGVAESKPQTLEEMGL